MSLLRRKPDERDQVEERRLWRAYTAGIEFVVTILVMGWLGWMVDGWLGLRESFPVFLVVGIFAGLFGSTLRLKRWLDQPRPPKGGPGPEPRDPPSSA